MRDAALRALIAMEPAGSFGHSRHFYMVRDYITNLEAEVKRLDAEATQLRAKLANQQEKAK